MATTKVAGDGTPTSKTPSKLTKSSTHTAGIFADMTVDGPEIGTLVIVVDRARHLPNRKTMGKQDPYCAVRLAKEAKKTETDRRGGQTPRWDQELRFTVYDSPDYHRLKVSLFNDDKRCDLIGETWVSLDNILEHGGGQRDEWHTLHCRGRYAGEIQLELTFWDLRPKDDRPVVREEKPARNSDVAVAGPRQPMKRRPLPAEPNAAGSSRSGPHRSATEQPPAPQSFGPRELPSIQSAPPAPQQQPQPPHHREHQYDEPQNLHSTLGEHRELDGDWNAQQQHYYDDGHPGDYASNAFPAPDHARPSAQFGGMDLPELPPHTPRAHRASAPHQPKHYSAMDRQPAEYVLPQYHSPDSFHSSPTGMRPDALHMHSSPALMRPDAFHSSPAPMRPDALHNSPAFPPLPPSHSNHRFSMPATAHGPIPERPPPGFAEPEFDGRVAHSHSYQDFGDPRAERQVAHSHSYQDFSEYPDRFRVPSPVDTQLSTHSAPLMHEDPRMARREEPYMVDYGANSRFEPQHRHSIAEPPNMRNAGMSSFATPSRHDLANTQPEEARVHRSSVPVIRPQPQRSPGPDPHRSSIARKSVSPAAPSPASDGGLPGGVAFSPDSFDVLNPNLRTQGSINLPGPKYATPEGIREAARDRRREMELEQHGPIVDGAGRVVDPTDHLPSDTWAPEPEKKPLRKAHEVKIKFRHHPTSTYSPASSPGYRDSPAAPSPPTGYRDSPPPPAPSRPHSMQATPAAHSSPVPVAEDSPSHGRQRLQKKTPRGAYQPASPPSSFQSSPPPVPGYAASYAGSRQSYQGTPLREMQPNYGYGSSPAGGAAYGGPQSSPAGGAPPPRPAKIPLAGGQEEWSASSPMAGGLEQAMRDIDIGPGSGGRRTRGWRDI